MDSGGTAVNIFIISPARSHSFPTNPVAQDIAHAILLAMKVKTGTEMEKPRLASFVKMQQSQVIYITSLAKRTRVCIHEGEKQPK